MCSKEEVQRIINASEKKTEDKIDAIAIELNERLELSHKGINETISNFGADVQKLTKTFEHVEPQDLNAILKFYNGMMTLRSFAVGLGSFVLAMGAIGAGVIWVVKAALIK